MENYFNKFRDNIIGINQTFINPFKEEKKIIYADWAASGRSYKPLEERLCNDFLPFVANTHTETNTTGLAMTYAYHKAREIIKSHVNAGENEVLISAGSGMTGVVNKFQRILGMKIHEKFRNRIKIPEEKRPVVFITHMEHHSNQTSWLETIADVEIIMPDKDGLVNYQHFEELLEKHKNRQTKIAAVSAASNVTGIENNYYKLAKMIHRAGGYCFVDFAYSAPYVKIDMHPADPEEYLDAIYFSPHKFLGGPGSSGILLFNQELYRNTIPDNPGGGTVDWTNPWGGHKYVDSIEAREDGGTPGFIQTIRVALTLQLKEEMGVENILQREKEQIDLLWAGLCKVDNLHILADNQKERLGVISFYIDKLHYNAGVKLLNDKFGIQVRGGCSCAGTYGHYLLNLKREDSKHITELINHYDFSEKPGWIRMSIHPTMTNDEISMITESICELAKYHPQWAKDYVLEPVNNTIRHKDQKSDNRIKLRMEDLFDKDFSEF
ncbi:MAG TPA: aminotransferase class V-fold PLP-dependent enzyme [Bacteroidales bacterium]|nr:aminotransferase class V-fold PLP-dependent enzyme [Bacteroidales bacterium]